MQRRKIALIGGGQIGSIIALMITQRELAADVVVLDLPENVNPIKGKMLDISHLCPHYDVDVNLHATSDYADIEGADVVVITAGVPRKPNMTREDLLDINIGIIKHVAEQVKRYAPEAFVVLTTNPVDTMTHAFHKVSGFPKQRVAGLSGALDTGRFASFIAQATGVSVKDVSCLVMGGHGPTMIPLTRTANVAGVPVTSMLSKDELEGVIRRTREAGTEIVNLLGNGSAFFSSASAVMEMVVSYLDDKKRIIASSTLCEGEYGIDGYFLGVPCVIGAGGVERVVEIELDDDEKAMLQKTLSVVKDSVAEAKL